MIVDPNKHLIWIRDLMIIAYPNTFSFGNWINKLLVYCSFHGFLREKKMPLKKLSETVVFAQLYKKLPNNIYTEPPKTL